MKSLLVPLVVAAEPFYLVLNDLHMHGTYQASADRLSWFCAEALPAIKQGGNLKFIVLNGDLTDSGSPVISLEGPGERPLEWQLLKDALAPCLHSTLVFALRGNHDSFNVDGGFNDPSNRLFLDFQNHVDSSNKQKGILPVRMQDGGSFVVHVDDQTFIFIDNSRSGRRFFAWYTEEMDAWVRSALKLVKKDKSVTVFSHYPTGTVLPDDRLRLMRTIEEYSAKIKSYQSGHVHFTYGFRAQTEVSGINELVLVDFAYAGYARLVTLDESVVVDFTVSDKQLPLLGATKLRNGTVVAAAFGCDEHAGLFALSDSTIDKVTCGSKVVTVVNDRMFTGFTQCAFLHNYESWSIAALLSYVILVCFLYWFGKTANDLSDTLTLVNGLIFPIIPWAIGHEVGGKLVMVGVWGVVNLRTWQVSHLDMAPLMLVSSHMRLVCKILALKTTLGSVANFVASLLLAIMSLVYIKLMVISYGTMIFLSPVVLWEVATWSLKALPLLTRSKVKVV